MEWPEVLAQPSLTSSQLLGAFRAALLESPLIGRVTDVANEPLMLDAWKASDGQRIRLDITRLDHDFARCDLTTRLRLFQDRLDSALEIAGLPEVEQPLREQVIPRIQSAHWHASASAMCRETLAAVGFVGELVVVFARDRKSTYSYLAMSALEREGVTIAELQPLALANLRARVPRELSTRGDGKSFLFTAGGNIEASLLLLPEIWNDLETQLPGEIIACALARDVLLVTARGIPGGLASLVDARDRIHASMEPSDLISTTLLVRRAGRWQCESPS